MEIEGFVELGIYGRIEIQLVLKPAATATHDAYAINLFRRRSFGIRPSGGLLLGKRCAELPKLPVP